MDEQFPVKFQKTTLATMMISSFISTFSASSITLAIPAISADFGDKATTMNWVVTIYVLISAMLSIPFSRLADIKGRRRIYQGGLLLFALSSGACAFATSASMILIPRIFQGISGAMIFSTNTAILVNAFPKERRGKVLGYSVMMVYAGLSMGPVLGGVLTHNFKWPSIFIVSMIFGLIAFIVAVIGLPKTDDTAHSVTGKGKYDLPGMLLYSIMIFCILYGFSSIGAGSSFDFAFTVFGAQLIFRFNLLLIILGVVLALIFGRHELRARLPVLQLRLFKKNPNFLFSNLASLLNYGATYAVTYLLSIYLQLIALYDAQITGIILIIQPLIQTVLSPLAGRLSDKYSPFKLASLGMAFCTAGLVSYLFITVDTSMVHIIINLVIVGIGFALFSSPNTNAIMSSVKPQDSTVASSLISTMRNLGHVTSMAILTLIMSAHLGSATFQDATPEQLVDTMHTGFIVFTIICAVGIFVSLQRKKK